MKLRVIKKFVDQETDELLLPKKQITRDKDRGQKLIDKGYCAEVKSRKKKADAGKKTNKAKVFIRACVFQIGVNILGLPKYRAHIISDIPSKIKYLPQVKQVDYLN